MPMLRKIAIPMLCSMLLLGCQMPKNASELCYDAVIARYSEDTQGRLGKLENGKWFYEVTRVNNTEGGDVNNYRVEIDSLSGKWCDVWIASYYWSKGSVAVELVGHYEPRWF